MSRSARSSIPSREAVRAERVRRSTRRLAEAIAALADPEMPAWPEEADEDPESWAQANWSQAALDAFETEGRALYFAAIDTVMGAVALAVWDAGRDESAVRALVQRVGLPPWPAGSSAEEVRIFRRDHWSAWESVYFEKWWGWVPLPEDERRRAHEKEWRRHLRGEAAQVRASGPFWWRTMTMPNPEYTAASVDITAGLSLALERGHDETYPRPEGDEEGEQG